MKIKTQKKNHERTHKENIEKTKKLDKKTFLLKKKKKKYYILRSHQRCPLHHPS
jgi:hypothetical protein